MFWAHVSRTLKLPSPFRRLARPFPERIYHLAASARSNKLTQKSPITLDIECNAIQLHETRANQHKTHKENHSQSPMLKSLVVGCSKSSSVVLTPATHSSRAQLTLETPQVFPLHSQCQQRRQSNNERQWEDAGRQMQATSLAAAPATEFNAESNGKFMWHSKCALNLLCPLHVPRSAATASRTFTTGILIIKREFHPNSLSITFVIYNNIYNCPIISQLFIQNNNINSRKHLTY